MTQVCVQIPGCSLLPDLYRSRTPMGRLWSHDVTLGKWFWLFFSYYTVKWVYRVPLPPMLYHCVTYWVKKGDVKWGNWGESWSDLLGVSTGSYDQAHVSSRRRTKITLWCVFPGKHGQFCSGRTKSVLGFIRKHLNREMFGCSSHSPPGRA